MTDIRIADGFSLPLDVLTEAIGIVATRGAGKSSTSVVLIEEAHAAAVQVVVVDPTGVYFGLRTAADGKGDGLPFYVFGGAHGDLPLEPTAGRLLADVTVDSGHSLVLDVSDFSKGKARAFVADFLERLYERKARARTTLLLVLDEADEWAPQLTRQMRGEAPRCLGAVEQVVKRGRSRGVGAVLISQRTQAINKDVLDLVDTMFALRLGAPRSRATVAEWLEVKEASDDQGVIASLSSLPTGTAWVWSPVRGILERVEVRRIRTFDSYRTPKPGETLVEPSARAELDLAALGEQMAATVERAKENDPADLRRRIRELEQKNFSLNALPQIELMTWARGLLPTLGVKEPREGSVEIYLSLIEEAVAGLADRKPERVEVPVVRDEDVRALAAAAEPLAIIGQQIEETARELRHALDPLMENIAAAHSWHLRHASPERPIEKRGGHQPRASGPPPTEPPPKRSDARRAADPAANGDAPTLNRRAERMVLAVLAQYPEGRTKRQTAILAGYALNGGGFGGALSKLRTLGLIEGSDPLRITDAGLGAIEGQYEPLPTGRALLDHWLGTMKRRAEREVLQVVYDAWPDAISKEEVAARAGYEVSGGGFCGAVSKLRTLELISGSGELRLADALRE